MMEKGPLLPQAEQRPSRSKPSSGSFIKQSLLGCILLGSLFVYSGYAPVTSPSSYLRQAFTIRFNGAEQEQRVVSTAPVSATDKLCLTPECIHAASKLLYQLSPTYQQINPCEDFEEMVCGGWRERHDMRSDQGRIFEGTLMAERAQTLLRHILEADYPHLSAHSHFSPAQLESADNEIDQRNFRKLKAAYNACLDEEAIKDVGIEPLMQLLKNLHRYDQYSDAMIYLAGLDVQNMLVLGPDADARDPDTVVVNIVAPRSIGLPAKEYYDDDDKVKEYIEVIEKVFSALKSEVSDLNIKPSLAKEVVGFEQRLSKAMPDAEDMYDVTKTYNPMSLSHADALLPELELTKQLRHLVPHGVKTDRVIVYHPQYMTALHNTLKETPKETVLAYLHWKVIQSFAGDIEASALEPYQEFKNILVGQDPKAKSERWRTCLGHVDSNLGWLLSRFYVEKAFSAEAKRMGDEVTMDIKNQFVTRVQTLEWMEDSVKELAIQKVHNIVQKVGYPTQSPNITDPADLQSYYGSVHVKESSFFENVLAFRHFDVHSDWSSLGKPVNRAKWQMTADTVNAYYNPSGNEIVFPAAIMQLPLFDANVPQYLSYGAFGSVAGHELSHAFDNNGRHYDQIGNYTDWWTDKTVEEFEKRAKCFISEYNNFTIEGPTPGTRVHVNGELTQGENIADAGGIDAAFAAWKTRAAKSAPEANLNLPGLDFFTQEQLFFVNYGSFWCGKSTRQRELQLIYTDPHAPEWARVLGATMNSRDFKRAFDCPVKEPACELW